MGAAGAGVRHAVAKRRRRAEERSHVAFISFLGSDAPALLLKAARRLEPFDLDLARDTYLTAWGAALVAADLAREGVLLEICRAVRALPPPPGTPRPLDLLLDGLALLITEGHAAATPTLQQAAKALADLPVEDILLWGWLAASASALLWDIDGMRASAAREVRLLRDAGALAALPSSLSNLGIATAWLGDFSGAASLIAETDSVAAAIGSRQAPYALLRLVALRGKEAEAAAAIAGAEQRQRIPLALSDDPVPDPRVQLEPHGRAQQRAGIAVAHTVHLQLGHVPKFLAQLAGSEHDPDRLRQEATGDERERQHRRLIQPLGVIDDAQERSLLGHHREQAQHRQPDEEPIRGSAGAQPEHDLDGLALRRRELLEPVEQWPAQLVQTGEGQLHVRLHALRPEDRHVRSRHDQVVQQRGLPDPGLAPHHQRPALAAVDRRDQIVEQGALARPAA
jgi:hypothetical protein